MDPTPPPARRLWLTGERAEPARHGAAVPIRTVIGAPATPGRMSRGARVGARWGVWVLALAAVGAGGAGLWHLLYGDRVSGEVWLGRPPAALATTTTTSSTTTTTTTLPATTTTAAGPGPAVADGGSSGPGPGSGTTAVPEAGDDRRPVLAAAPAAPTPSVTVADDHGGRSSNRQSGSSGSGSSGSGSSGSGSSGSGSSDSD